MNPNVPYNTGTFENMVDKIKVYCSHIIPLVFNNTLTYYECLCACVAKVNELCDAVNSQNLAIVEFTHMVELEVDKFEKYVQAELTSFGERITEIEGAITEIRGAIDTINEELSYKVDKRTDVTDSVVENSEQVITSGGIYHALRYDIPDATTQSKGVVQIGDGIQVVNGIISPRIATHQYTGVVKPTNALLITQDGSLEPRLATNERTGIVQVGDNIDITQQGIISVPDGDYGTKGALSVGANLTVNNGIVDVPVASNLQRGVMATGSGLSASNGVVSVNTTNEVTENDGRPITSGGVYDAFQDIGENLPDATYVNKGVITVDGVSPDHALTLNNGVLDINNASSALKGAVKIGDNINVTNGGIISVPEANAVTKGVVTINALDSNLTLNNGVLDVPTGTKTNKGVLQVGSHLTVNSGVVDVPVADNLGTYGVVAPSINSAIEVNQGEIDVKDATTTTKGAVRITNSVQSGDTTHVPTSDAVYNAVTGLVPPQINDATTTTKGIVQIGDNINVSSGLISVPNATSSTYGVVKPDTNSTIQFDNGKITCNNAKPAVADSGNYGTVRLGTEASTGLLLDSSTYELKIATAGASQLGGVKVGSNLDIDANGVLDVPIADSTTKGVVGVDALGGNVTLNNGIIDVPTATTSTKGVVSVGDNLEVSGGRVSVPTADSTTKGVVTVDALTGNLTLNNGVIDVPTGSKNAKGVLQVGSHLSVSGGMVDVPLADDLGGAYGVVAPGLNSAVTCSQGEIDVKTATTSTKGVVTLANSVTSGDTSHVPTADAVYNAITGASVADATTTSKGIVQIGSNIDVANGVISVPTANGSTTYGVVRLGSNSNLSMGNDGIIDVYTGTKNNKGVLQVGTNLSVASGVVDVPDADTTTKGVIEVGDNLIVSSGRVSVPLAGGSSSVAGVVAIDSTNTPLYTDHNDNEILKIRDATTTSKGIVQVGSGLTVSGGTISVPSATTSTPGIVTKTTSIASGSTDVPTSDAVYTALQGVGLRKYSIWDNYDSNSYKADIDFYAQYPANATINVARKELVVTTNNQLDAGVDEITIHYSPFGDYPSAEQLAFLNLFKNDNNPIINYICPPENYSHRLIGMNLLKPVDMQYSSGIYNYAYLVLKCAIYSENALPSGSTFKVTFDVTAFG